MMVIFLLIFLVMMISTVWAADKPDWLDSGRIAINRSMSEIGVSKADRNQRLRVMDFGKHNYTLLSGNEGNGFRLTLKRQHYDDEEEYDSLDQKMQARQVTLDEVVQFQKLLDVRVKYLMGLCPEDFYQVKPVKSLSRPVETASICLICDRCGQQVLKSRIVNYEGKAYCLPCFQRLNIGCTGYGLQ